MANKLTHKEFDRRVLAAMAPATSKTAPPELLQRLTELAKQRRNNGNNIIAG